MSYFINQRPGKTHSHIIGCLRCCEFTLLCFRITLLLPTRSHDIAYYSTLDYCTLWPSVWLIYSWPSSAIYAMHERIVGNLSSVLDLPLGPRAACPKTRRNFNKKEKFRDETGKFPFLPWDTYTVCSWSVPFTHTKPSSPDATTVFTSYKLPFILFP